MSTESIASNPPAHAVELWYGPARLVPAPLVEWIVESEHDPNSKIRTTQTTRIKLDGSFVIVPNGSYERMFEMQDSLREAFSVDGYEFRIVAGAGNATLPSGAPIVSGLYPQITNVSVEPDIQVNFINYTVDMFVESTSVSGQPVTDLSDSWELSENEEDIYLNVTHNVSARGINTLSSGTNAIHNAISTVTPLLGLSNLPYYLPQYTQPNASGGGTVNIYEVSVQRSESVDRLAGTYSVTENFILASGADPYVHNRTASFEEDENGTARVTLNGNIRGLGRTNYNLDGGIGFERAYAGFAQNIRPLWAVDASGVYAKYKLNEDDFWLFTTNPLSQSVTENKFAGTINYTVSYTDDPSENLPSGILEAASSVQRTDGIRLYASHPIPFRRLGPVLQDIKTTTEGQITITASAKAKNTGDVTVDTNRAITYVQDEINRLRPDSVNFETLRIGGIDQTYSDLELTAQASVAYIFTVDLATVTDTDSDIVLTTL